jgi:hypothetical protein
MKVERAFTAVNFAAGFVRTGEPLLYLVGASAVVTFATVVEVALG